MHYTFVSESHKELINYYSFDFENELRNLKNANTAAMYAAELAVIKCICNFVIQVCLISVK